MVPPTASELDSAVYTAVQQTLYKFYGAGAFNSGYGIKAVDAAKRAIVDTTLKIHGSKSLAAKMSGLCRSTYIKYSK